MPGVKSLAPVIVGPIAALALLFPGAAEGGAVTETVDAWAYPQLDAIVRSDPSDSAPSVSKLHFLTELRAPEVYRVTGKQQSEAPDGREWLRIDVLGRPNGRVGWVPADSLGRLRPIRETLVIKRSALQAVLYRGKHRIWSAPIAIGRGKWPTPAGDFYIREGVRIKRGGGVYGSFAFGTSAYSPGLSDWPGGGVIGIHGTNQPDLIPGRISHGCIRLRNPQINRLRRLSGVGTAVEIR
jgi:L,D-transpeptidase catalytic domain